MSITLEGMEKIKTEQMTRKQSEQPRKRASRLKYILGPEISMLSRKNVPLCRQNDNN